jgi:hypothetical protein
MIDTRISIDRIHKGSNACGSHIQTENPLPVYKKDFLPVEYPRIHLDL